MKHDTINRFALIETMLLWGDGLTARELGDICGLARQNAQAVISTYRERHPDDIRTDRKLKRQVAADSFKPHYINKEAGAFLDYQRALSLMGYFKDGNEDVTLPFHDVDRLLRHKLYHEPARAVIAGIRRHETVAIYYHAKSGARMRIISPNTMIFAGNRYHLRAYCHLKEGYLDFVISRIVFAEAAKAQWVSSHDDTAWNTRIMLRFEPEPKLSADVANALRIDYGIDKGETFNIRCRKALGFYVKRELLAVDDLLKSSRWMLVDEMVISG